VSERRKLKVVAAPAPELGRREAGKAERRARIIQAARELIRETGDAGLSMRALAERAGVSLATPYNLFGSKGAIVLAVLEDVRQFHGRFATLRTADPMERIFAALEIAVRIYIEDPAFYRTLWRAVFAPGNEVRAAILNDKAAAFWRSLVDEASAAGAIQPEIDPHLLAIQLDMVRRTVMLDWSLGELASEHVALVMSFGFAMTLNGVVAPEWRGPMRARLLQFQTRLLEIGPEKVDVRKPRNATD
jgi:AcrR family transcriptional regulator